MPAPVAVGVDGEYVTDLGKRSTFTLFVIAKTYASTNTRLQVEYLPFTFDNEKDLQLNKYELEKYTTPFVEVGK